MLLLTALHPVAEKAIPTTAAGGWTITGLVTSIAASGTFGGIVLAYFKFLPTWKELGIGQRRDELTRINDRLDKVETENRRLRECVSDSERKASEMNSIITTLNIALQLATSELARKDPDNSVLKQARELVATVASKDMGLGQFHAKLAEIPGLARNDRRS